MKKRKKKIKKKMVRKKKGMVPKKEMLLKRVMLPSLMLKLELNDHAALQKYLSKLKHK